MWTEVEAPPASGRRAEAQVAAADGPAGARRADRPGHARRERVADRDVEGGAGAGVGDRDREADLFPGVDDVVVGRLGDDDVRAVDDDRALVLVVVEVVVGSLVAVADRECSGSCRSRRRRSRRDRVIVRAGAHAQVAEVARQDVRVAGVSMAQSSALAPPSVQLTPAGSSS